MAKIANVFVASLDMTQYSMSGTTSSGGNGGIMTTAVSGYRTSNTNTSAS